MITKYKIIVDSEGLVENSCESSDLGFALRASSFVRHFASALHAKRVPAIEDFLNVVLHANSAIWQFRWIFFKFIIRGCYQIIYLFHQCPKDA